MTYKEKLVKFVKLKRNHIKKFGFVYADHRDYKDIRSWSEKRCEEIYSKMVNRIMSPNGSKELTGTTCPWCLYNYLYHTACPLCSYGKRHGECPKKDSLYKKYATNEVSKSLTNKVYRNMVNKINQYQK